MRVGDARYNGKRARVSPCEEEIRGARGGARALACACERLLFGGVDFDRGNRLTDDKHLGFAQ